MEEVKNNPLQFGLEGIPIISKPQKTLAEKNAWHKLDPTGRQTHRIARLCMALGIKDPLEETVSNRMEARNLINELRIRLRLKRQPARNLK